MTKQTPRLLGAPRSGGPIGRNLAMVERMIKRGVIFKPQIISGCRFLTSADLPMIARSTAFRQRQVRNRHSHIDGVSRPVASK